MRFVKRIRHRRSLLLFSSSALLILVLALNDRFMLFIGVLLPIIYAFAIFGFIKFFTEKDVELDNFASVKFENKTRPQNLVVQDQQIINRGDGKYDVVITIQNPNEKFFAKEVKYKIVISGIQTQEKATFIMPGEKKKIVELSIPSANLIDDVDISFIEIAWYRIKQKDVEKRKEQVFEIKEQSININPEDRSIRNWIEFKVKNISPYNLKQSKFYVFLYVGSQIVATNQIEQTYFKSNEERNMQSSWYYVLPSYATLEVQYETNLLDKNNYFIETK